jgi:hypothetical protein
MDNDYYRRKYIKYKTKYTVLKGAGNNDTISQDLPSVDEFVESILDKHPDIQKSIIGLRRKFISGPMKKFAIKSVEGLENTPEAIRKHIEKEYEEYREEYRGDYRDYERRLRNGERILPPYPMGGNLSLEMTLGQITNVLQDKINTMKVNGKVITAEQFGPIEQGIQSTGNYNQKKWISKGGDIDRIYGAEFLEKQFAEKGETNRKVPDYIIVVKEPVIKITLRYDSAGDCYPRADIDTNTAEIFAEFIEGEPTSGHSYFNTDPELSFGYSDISSNDNILRTEAGNMYYIDTERKSFYNQQWLTDGISTHKIEKGHKMCGYLYQRFLTINNLGPDNAFSTKLTITAPQ